MNKQLREVTKEDLLSIEEYSKKRKTIRKEIVSYKKNRRISVGPYANFYFESFETMKAQIQEMLYIEKGGEEQLKDELAAYNPLIPKGNELVATLMFEIDDPTLRLDFLNKCPSNNLLNSSITSKAALTLFLSPRTLNISS